MKTHFTICVFALAFLTLTLTLLPVGAAQIEVSPPAQSSPPNTSDLMAQAVQEGHVRVIVALNVPFQVETQVSAAEIGSQRILIQQTQQQVSALLAGTNSQTVATFETIPYITIDADAAAIQTLSQSRLVRQIIQETVLYPLLQDSVPFIGAPGAWAEGFDGTGQVVAILDSGVDSSHPFLSGKVIPAAEACYSLSGGTKVPLCPNGTIDPNTKLSIQTGAGAAIPCTFDSDLCFHGTHVAGIAAGTNATFSGVARGAKIIAVQVSHGETNSQICGRPQCILSESSEVLKGLEWVYQNRSTYNIAAVNLSLGTNTTFGGHCDDTFPQYYDMFALLRSVGIAVVAGSGNSRVTNGISAPACISNAISVGATNHTANTIWTGGSNSASILDLLAPGVDINSSKPGNVYGVATGTSMATPHVTGAIAVLRNAKSNATVDEILTALQTTGVVVTDPANGVMTPRIKVDTAADAWHDNNLPKIGNIVINEIRVQNTQAIELFNAGTSSINMNGWSFIAYAGNGSIETTYAFPAAFTLNAGSYVMLNRAAGSNTSTNLFMGAYSTAWASGGSGAALLLSGNIGIDFVRWGTATKMPSIGTAWSGTNPAGPPAGQNLGRDPLTKDLDDSSEWSIQTPTLGAVNQVVRPSNDDFANSALISSLPYTNSVATFTASKQLSEPNPSCLFNADGTIATIGRTVWYKFTAVTGGVVSFDTTGSGSSFDTAMGVWTGSWGALTEVGCNDDLTAGSVIQSKVSIAVNPGTAYYVQVGGLNGVSGQLKFNASITPPPANDDFANYKSISALPYTDSLLIAAATKQSGEPNPSCASNIGKTVWYRYAPTTSGLVEFDTTGSNFDTALALWTGSWGSLSEAGCNNDISSGSILQSKVSITVSAGTTYYIQAGGFNGASGQLKFNAKVGVVVVPTTNDEFSAAAIIKSLPYTVNENTTSATEAADDPFPWCNDAIRNTVWFRYTAPATETIRFETSGSNFDTVLSIWRGTQGQLTKASDTSCNDDVQFLNFTSSIDLPVVVGNTYHIMVSGGFIGSTGNLVFKVTSRTAPPSSLNPPTLSAPLSGATIDSTTPTFRWLPASNAASYQIQLGTTPALTSDPILVIGTSYTPLTPLAFATYYWRVRSMGTGGAVSAWSSPTRTLILGSGANAAPSLNFDPSLPIRLTWTAIDWALEYEIQVDTETSFADPRTFDLLVSESTQFVQLDTLTPGSYYWRVRARLNATQWGYWSPIQSFTFKP